MERDRDTGTQHQEGSCVYGSDDTAEDIDIRSDGDYKGEDSDSALQRAYEFQGEAILGNHFWSRGYCVTTIGMDEDKIRRYVKYQEEREKQEENNSKDYGLFESPDS